MSRFRKFSHTIWHCQYHIVWVPKYRYRVLTGHIAEEVSRCIRTSPPISLPQTMVSVPFGRVSATVNQAVNAAFQRVTPTILKTDRW